MLQIETFSWEERSNDDTGFDECSLNSYDLIYIVLSDNINQITMPMPIPGVLTKWTSPNRQYQSEQHGLVSKRIEMEILLYIKSNIRCSFSSDANFS